MKFIKSKMFLSSGILSFLVCICFLISPVLINECTDSDLKEQTDNAIEFVYMPDSQVEVGDTQQIYVSFNDGIEAENATLNYEKEGQQEPQTSKATYVKNGVAEFNLPFNNKEEIGKYEINKVSWEGSNAGFQSIDTNEKLGYSFSVTNSSEAVDENDIPAGVYSIGENGLTKQNTFADALASNSQMMFTKEGLEYRPPANGNIVVALDPGHGGSEPGAVYDGHMEKDLNLKIARACRDELQQYYGVSVYMVRDGDEYVGLRERVDRALANNANIFVCLHNNSGGGNGAEVYVPHQGGWCSDHYVTGSDIGSRILAKLNQKLGLQNRGIKEKYATDGSKYPDGTAGDYYTVMFHARENKLPSILVEHAFMDGGGADAEALYNDNNLTAMGRCDAEAIAEHYGLYKEPAEMINGTYKISVDTDHAKSIDVDSSSTKDWANVYSNTSKEITSQKWRIVSDSNVGYTTVINANSNKALDLYSASVKDGTNIDQYSHNDTHAQHWRFIKKAENTYEVESVLNIHSVWDVDVKSGNLQLWTSNHTKNQRFILTKVASDDKPAFIDDGEYVISSALNNKKVLDIDGASKADYAKLQLYDSNMTGAQRWKITTDENGFSTIKNINSNKVINDKWASTDPFMKLWQYTDDGSKACKWKIIKDNDGYRIVSAVNENLAMDVEYACTDNYTSIWTYFYTGANSEKFYFYKVPKPLDPSTGIKITDGNYKINSVADPSKCVDVQSETEMQDGGKIQIWKDYNNNDNQVFYFERLDDGYYKIMSKKTGKVLDADLGNVVPGAKVIQWEWGKSYNQKWVIIEKTKGNYQIVNALNSYALNIPNTVKDGQHLNVMPDSGKNMQLWTINEIRSFPGEIVNGSYIISSTINNRKILDVASNSTHDNANIQIYDFNNTSAQKFEITTDPDTKYAIIKHAGTSKVLDIENGYATAGANIVQKEYNINSLTQKWKFVKHNDSYVITSVLDDYYVLDLKAACTDNFTNIQLYYRNDTPAQIFNIYNLKPVVPQPAITLEDGTYSIISAANQSKCLDLPTETSYQYGSKIQIWDNYSTVNQAFRIVKDGEYYKISSELSYKVLDEDLGCVIPGSSITQWDWGAVNNQRWAISVDNKGYYTFTNVASGLALDLCGGSTYNGNIIHAWTPNGTDAQKWILKKPAIPVKTPIMTAPKCNWDKFVKYFNNSGHSYPAFYADKDCPSLDSFCKAVYDISITEGVDPAIIFCQMMRETGWLQYQGQVRIDQFNFGGIKTADGKGFHSFVNMREGILAHVEHLKAYASTAPLVNPCVDPRFSYVTRGCAPYVEDLSGKWSEGYDYGIQLVNMLNTMLKL